MICFLTPMASIALLFQLPTTTRAQGADSFLLDTCNCFCGPKPLSTTPRSQTTTASPVPGSSDKLELAGSIPIFGLSSSASCSNTSCLGYFPVACHAGAEVRAGCAHCEGGLNGNTFAHPPDVVSGGDIAGVGSASPTDPMQSNQDRGKPQKGFNIPPGAASQGRVLMPCISLVIIGLVF